MLHFLLSFLDAGGVPLGRSVVNHFFPFFAAPNIPRLICRKKSLGPRFAIPMPARVRIPIAKLFMYLAGLNSIVTSAKNPKSWEKFINHNWALVDGISGFLGSPLALLPFQFVGINKSQRLRTNLSNPVHNLIRLPPTIVKAS